MKLLLPALLSILAFAALTAQKTADSSAFFPFTPGTYWVYKGTVRWEDAEEEKPGSTEVTWKMFVERVIHKNGITGAVITGYPADLDWSAGTTTPKPWLFLETPQHQIYYENLGPDYDLSKLAQDDEHVFDKFLVDDTLFFQWPLQQDAKFCDPEAKKRDDNMYCWVVTQIKKSKPSGVIGLPADEQSVFQLQYRTLPDDTTIELVPGVGLLSYEYHHHGTVADTQLRLIEFHPATDSPQTQGSKP